MRAKCPKCGNIFEVKPGFSFVHAGPYRRIKCPACGKKSMMNNFINDPITWPPKEKEEKDESR
jgi:DNA-directed RNA polymerase subunit RPC12/RpoP